MATDLLILLLIIGMIILIIGLTITMSIGMIILITITISIIIENYKLLSILVIMILSFWYFCYPIRPRSKIIEQKAVEEFYPKRETHERQ
jgi:hypothetical protein